MNIKQLNEELDKLLESFKWEYVGDNSIESMIVGSIHII